VGSKLQPLPAHEDWLGDYRATHQLSSRARTLKSDHSSIGRSVRPDVEADLVRHCELPACINSYPIYFGIISAGNLKHAGSVSGDIRYSSAASCIRKLKRRAAIKVRHAYLKSGSSIGYIKDPSIRMPDRRLVFLRIVSYPNSVASFKRRYPHVDLSFFRVGISNVRFIE